MPLRGLTNSDWDDVEKESKEFMQSPQLDDEDDDGDGGLFT